MEKTLKRSNIFLIVLSVILGIALVTFIVLYSVSMSKQNELKLDLENIYQRNYSELVDNINNSEIKLSKVAVSGENAYSRNLLSEISKNTAQATANLGALPLSIHGINETIKFINQVSGYTQTLSNKLDRGESLTENELNTLRQLKDAFSILKDNINDMSEKIYNGKIYDASMTFDGDLNKFTQILQNLKSKDVEYPAMIYDGPFSDSMVNKEIKNLNFSKVTSDVAKNTVLELFKNVDEQNITYLGETNGHFKTYDFKLSTISNNAMYVQITQNGSKLLTLSVGDIDKTQNYSLSDAENIAIDFTILTGIKDTKCVWSDVVGGDAYINLAPVQDGVILYPDLVKVKVDLSTGNVVGFEASSYYTNHTQRKLGSAVVSVDRAKDIVSSDLYVKETRLCLAPLEYNREILCYENICTNGGATYYVYVNAENGEIENILKVIDTDNGSLLM